MCSGIQGKKYSTRNRARLVRLNVDYYFKCMLLAEAVLFSFLGFAETSTSTRKLTIDIFALIEFSGIELSIHSLEKMKYIISISVDI